MAEKPTYEELEQGLKQLEQAELNLKNTEETLRESEAKYRELVQHANCIILRFDAQGRITFFNEYAQIFFGYTEDEILNQNVVGTEYLFRWPLARI